MENANTLNQFDLYVERFLKPWKMQTLWISLICMYNIKLQSMDVSIFVALLLLDFNFIHTVKYVVDWFLFLVVKAYN